MTRETKHRRQRRALLALLGLMGLMIPVAAAAQRAPIVVTTILDNGNDANPVVGSLRDAIKKAVNGDTITFNIGNGVQTIQVRMRSLPSITQNQLTIDGTTRPGQTVQLDGSLAGAGADGLTIRGQGCTVNGLVINRFKKGMNSGGVGIFILGNNSTIKNCRIGVNPAGTARLPNEDDGIAITGSGNTVGGRLTGSNIIAGNSGNGISIITTGRPSAADNVVLGNFIGTNLVGAKLGNMKAGVLIISAFDNTIGGRFFAGNVIADNRNNGVTVSNESAGNRIQGNFIGTNRAGARLGNTGIGVEISSASDNFVGEDIVTAGNVIVDTKKIVSPLGGLVFGDGVRISGIALRNRVQGNTIGVNATATAKVPNEGDGVALDAANPPNGIVSDNLIGGDNALLCNIT